MFWIKNLAGGQEVNPCKDGSFPWQFDRDQMEAILGAEKVRGIMKDKKTRSVYMTNPESDWHIYTFAEGLNPTARVGKDNPVVAITALAGDFDTKLVETYVETAKKLKHPPNWIEQSLSGNFRAVWVFESKIGVTGSAHARAILEKLAGHVKMKKIAPGLDKNSFNPAQTWTNGGAWLHLHDTPLSADLLKGFAIACMKGLKADGFLDGTVTDLKVMAEELAKRFPKFNNWPGEFELESQGPSFWVENSESPKSAIVKPWGMFTFAEQASKAAWGWHELVGKDVADSIVAKKMSDAASEIFFDGLKYFIRTSPNRWDGYGVEPLRRVLKIQHGLTGLSEPGGVSQIEEALHMAEYVNKVNAVAPCIPYPPGIISVNGKRFLNDWVDLSVKPAEVRETLEWGDRFPNIAEHINHLLHHPDAPEEPQALRFLDWLSVFYRSVLRKEPQVGQALFLLGGVGVGKGMLSGIVQIMVGGGTRAEELLTGRSGFGGECYDQPLMCVDDLAGLETRREVIKFTENLKARVANATGQNFHKKHQTPANIPWFGRIFVTMNDDDNSMSVFPDFTSSVEEKISLFHAAPTNSNFVSMFATLGEKRRIIEREAPFFACYLLHHYENMEVSRRDSRYGTKAYHFSLLREEVEDTQALGTMAEPLRDFLAAFFDGNPKLTFWQGKASTLFRDMQANGQIGPGTAYPHANVNKLGRQLRREESRDRNLVNGKRFSNSKVSALWTIKREFLNE